jgi:formamidopyrimidine-DNA glycosylase
MPELPDIQIYLEALERTVKGKPLEGIRFGNPFLLRSVSPPIEAFPGRRVTGLGRLGKRIVLDFEDEYFLILHLMIAGRLRWKKKGAGLPGRNGLAAFDFPGGTLLLTEAGSKRRASLHAVLGRASLEEHDRGGLDVLRCTRAEFNERLVSGNHTLKRALCDPTNFSGIGNAYSDEILHAAQLSPFRLTQGLAVGEIQHLFAATEQTLQTWIDRLRRQTGTAFPDKVTAFRPEMAVHGRYREPCPVCQSPIQRIVYASNEANYCARCQTGGKMLKDRALSRLLKSDWPRSIDEMEELRPQRNR